MINTALADGGGMLTAPENLLKARQLVVVVADSWQANNGQLHLFNRAKNDAAWRMAKKPWPVVIGKNGMAWDAGLSLGSLDGPIKKEGDGKTPAGVFALGQAFGFSPKSEPSLKLEYTPITATIVCVDDAASHYYGQIVDSAKIGQSDWKSAENMHNFPQQYQHGIVVNYNIDGSLESGGSCIFLHVKSSEAGTAGCTAMKISQINNLSNWLDPKENPVILQLPKDKYQQLKAAWGLPELPERQK